MATVIWTHGGSDAEANYDPKKNTTSLSARILDATGDIDAMVAIDAAKPLTVTCRGTVLVFDSISGPKHVECETYEATVKYVHPEKQEKPKDEEPQISFKIGGSSQHITHSEVRAAFPAGADKNKFKGAINFERDSKGSIKIRGLDTNVPTLGITVTKNIPQPANPFGFARTLARMAYKTNANAWNGFEPGELLFTDAAVKGKLRDKWTMEWTFDCSENITLADNVTFPNLGAIEKRGHDYFWIYWEQALDEATGKPIPVPVYGFSHIIRREGNFNVFAI